MIQRIKVWKVTCDICGRAFASGDNTEDHFQTKKEAIEVIKDDTYWWIEKGKYYCEKCNYRR